MSERKAGGIAVLLLGLAATGGVGAWLGTRLLAPPQPVASVANPAPQPAAAPPAQVQSPVAVASPAPAPEVVETPEPEPAPAPEVVETPEPEPAPEPEVVETAPPIAEEAPEPEAVAVAAPEPDAPALTSPTFDLVRVEADGTTLVAGAAGAGDTIVLLLDGVEVGRADAGSDGKFVSFLDLGPSLVVRVLQLQSVAGDLAQMSEEEVILAPPPVVAEAAPQPDTPNPDAPVGSEVATAAAPDPDAAAPETTQTPDIEQAASVENPAPNPPVAQPSTQDDTPRAEVTAPEAPQDTEIASAARVPAEPTQPAPDLVTDQVETALAQIAQNVEAVEEQVASVLDQGTSEAVEDAPEGAPTQESTSAEVAAADAPASDPAPQPSSPLQTAASVVQTPAPEPVAPTIPPQEVAVLTPSAPQAPGLVSAPQTLPSRQAGVATGTAPTAPAPLSAPAAAPTILISRPTGIEVLQNPQVSADAPRAPRGLALETITYSPAGEVVVAGRGEETASVRIYLNNQPVLTSPVDEEGQWRADLPQVDTGVYTLRVDQLDARGDVISRVESPFQREDPQLLAQAQAAATAPLQAITVQPGNTLWGIARERYGEGMSFVRVFNANRDRIRDPDLIYPGQIFDLPD